MLNQGAVFFFSDAVEAPNLGEQFNEFMGCVVFIFSFDFKFPPYSFVFSLCWEDTNVRAL